MQDSMSHTSNVTNFAGLNNVVDGFTDFIIVKNTRFKYRFFFCFLTSYHSLVCVFIITILIPIYNYDLMVMILYLLLSVLLSLLNCMIK